MKEVKTIILNVEENYNIIIIEQNKDYCEYYIQKINYGNLYFMLGINYEDCKYLDIKELFNMYKNTAEEENFWGID